MAGSASAEARPRLSRERVLDAAMALADRDGIASLSMRRLADELGVEAMSVYHYVASKDELLDAIVDLVVREFELPSGAADWQAAIRRSAISAHDVLMRHPWACALMMSAKRTSQARLLYMEALLRRLREAGFSPRLTHHAYHALDSHIIGSTLWEAGYTAENVSPELIKSFLGRLSKDEFPYLLEHAEQHLERGKRSEVREFEFGLDLILDGLARLIGGAGARTKRRRA